MENEEKLEVVPLTEVKAQFEELKKNHVDLKAQMDSDREATGLDAEKRIDDMKGYADNLEEISVKLEKVEAAQQQNQFASSFGQSAGELKDALESFGTGFAEFDGDNKAVEKAIGSKPSIKNLIEGVFTKSDLDPDAEGTMFHAPRHVAIRRLQKAWDDAYTVHACMLASKDQASAEEYRLSGGMKGLKTYKRFEQLAKTFTKAAGDLIDTTTEIPNWIPTQYSANLYEQIKIGLPLLNLFPEISMAAPTMVLPLDMNDNEAMRLTEVTSITNADPYADTYFNNPSAISSNKITFDAEKLRSRYWVSQEATEDSIVAMLPFLNRKHNRNIGEALEDAIINGQPTNIDTAGTHFGKANPLAADGYDARDCWPGLRVFSAAYGSTPAVEVDNSNGKPTVVGMRGLRAAMGEYGVTPGDVAYIFGLFGYIKLLDDSNVLTVDKFGPNATVRTGSLAQVDGVDVIVSRRIAQNLNASGIIDNVTTNRTQAFAVNTMGAILANRRRITLGQQVHGSSDTTELFAFWRGDFQPVYPTATVPAFGNLYNVIGA